MEKFTSIQSHSVALPIKNVDTDMIIPAQYLTSVSREGYGENLFRSVRDSDPAFPLNLPTAAGAQILIADQNFGCGSSREHAVWALRGAGFRAIIGKSFADIFASNSAKNGLLLVSLSDAIVDRLLQGNPEDQIGIDLQEQWVTLPDGEGVAFSYDPFRKLCLLDGLEDLDYILRHQADIAKFRSDQESVRFYRTTLVNNG